MNARRNEIAQRLRADGYVEAKKLAVELGVDASTIRRDLDELVRAGEAERTHGGARPAGGTTMEIPYALKENENRGGKEAIARAAAGLVADGDSVILDSGSTTFQVAVALRQVGNLTVLTNDLRIAAFVATLPDTRLLVSGGELLNSVFTLIGERAIDFFSDYSATWAFLGADAIDAVAGITNSNTLEVPIKRAMIAASATSVVVADHSKFGGRTLAKVAGIDEIDRYITDSALPAEQLESYDAEIMVAD